MYKLFEMSESLTDSHLSYCASCVYTVDPEMIKNFIKCKCDFFNHLQGAHGNIRKKGKEDNQKVSGNTPNVANYCYHVVLIAQY